MKEPCLPVEQAVPVSCEHVSVSGCCVANHTHHIIRGSDVRKEGKNWDTIVVRLATAGRLI